MGCLLSVFKYFKKYDEYDELKYRRKFSLNRNNRSIISETSDDESFDQPSLSDNSDTTISMGNKKHVRFAL